MICVPNIEVFTGCMFAGKTRRLIERCRGLEREGLVVHVVKPARDTRYAVRQVVSHDGQSIAATDVDETHYRELVSADVLAIDEAQFFSREVLEHWFSNLSLSHVIAAGLDLDWRGEPFGPMPWLFCVATKVTKLRAVCKCGAPACRTRLTVPPAMAVESNVIVGGAEMYAPKCLGCYAGAQNPSGPVQSLTPAHPHNPPSQPESDS